MATLTDKQTEMLTALAELLAPVDSSTAPPMTPTAVTVELDPELLDDIKALKQIRRDLTAAERAKKALTAKIYVALGDAEVGTINGRPVVIVNTVDRQDLDRELLKRAYPEALERCTVPNPYHTLSLKP